MLDRGLHMERSALPAAKRIKRLPLKVATLFALIPLVVIGLTVYALYARGAFEAHKTVTLIADNADGIAVGMPVTFSGFPIGNVDRMALTDAGEVRVQLQIGEQDFRWLRASSVFILDRPLIGSPRIRVSSPKLKDAPPTDDAQFKLVSADATADIPQVIALANNVLHNVDRLTNESSSLNRSLANLQTVTDRVAHSHMLDETEQAVVNLNAALTDARASLRSVDGVIASAQAAADNAKNATANIKDASGDLGALRAQVETSMNKVDTMIDTLNRRWPFARDNKVDLP